MHYIRAALVYSAVAALSVGAQPEIECRGFDSDTAPDALVASIANEATDAFAQLCGFDIATPSGQLVLHRTVESYAEADSRLTGGRYESNLAFAWRKPRQAHIAVQPASAFVIADDTAQLPMQTRRLLAHGSAHLARYATFPNHSSHPRWLADGLALVVSARVLGLPDLDPESSLNDPWSSTQVLRIQRTIRRGELPSIDAFMRGNTDTLSGEDQYAYARVLVAFMIERDTLLAITRTARQLGGGSNYASALADFATGELGQEADDEFKAFVRSLSPQWDELYRSLDTSTSPWQQGAFGSNAMAWNLSAPTSDTWKLSGQVTILPVGRQQMNLLLCRTQDGFISVAMGSSFGVTVFRYRKADNTWTRIGSAQAPGLHANESEAFSVECDGGHLTLSIADSNPIQIQLEPEEALGAWGIGAQSSSAGKWHKISMQPH